MGSEIWSSYRLFVGTPMHTTPKHKNDFRIILLLLNTLMSCLFWASCQLVLSYLYGHFDFPPPDPFIVSVMVARLYMEMCSELPCIMHICLSSPHWPVWENLSVLVRTTKLRVQWKAFSAVSMHSMIFPVCWTFSGKESSNVTFTVCFL